MIYLYTLYADLAPHPNEDVNAPEFHRKRKLGGYRDGVFRVWLMDNGIGPFPKTESEAERYEPLFVEYSRRNTMLYILFQRPDRCSVLNNGVWTDYPDMTTATREIYRVSPNDWIQYHRNVAFK